MNQRLYTPGPVTVPHAVADAVSASPLYHRSAAFRDLSRSVWDGLRDVFGSTHRVVVLAGTGMTGIEACIASTVGEGTTVLVVRHGRFGERLAQINRIYGATVVEIVAEWGEQIDAETIMAQCAEIPHIDAMWCVHSETSTGVCLDVASIARAVRERYPEALIMVDAVLSVGIEPLRCSEWGLDAAVAGIQKGLLCPPGLACVHMSERLEQRLHTQRRTYTTDLMTVVRDQDKGLFTWTPPVTLMAGLDAAIRQLIAIGMPAVWSLHADRARRIHDACIARGFSAFGVSNAHGVVVVEHPQADALRRRLEQEHSMIVAGGQDRLAGRVVRIGTCGAMTDPMIDELFEAVDTILTELT